MTEAEILAAQKLAEHVLSDDADAFGDWVHNATEAAEPMAQSILQLVALVRTLQADMVELAQANQKLRQSARAADGM